MNWLAIFSLVGKGLQQTIEISGKPMEVTCTARAMRALAQRQEPLIVEMELAYACFARKAVRFHDHVPARKLTFVTDRLAVYAHSVVPDYCNAEGGKPANTPSIAPRWLKLDYANGKWTGEYSL